MKALKYILISIILVDTGNIMVKFGLQNNPIEFGNMFSSYIGLLMNPLALIGFLAIALSSLFWLTALSKADLSYAYPMISLGYVVIAVASLIFFDEKIPLIRWLGIFTICSGVFLLSKSGEKK